MATLDLKREFKNRTYRWAEKLDVDVVWLGVRTMRNKWSSCSTNGHLDFSTDLLGLRQELWDYVIVHELLNFCWPLTSLMRAHLGEYEAYEIELKKIAHSIAQQRTLQTAARR